MDNPHLEYCVVVKEGSPYDVSNYVNEEVNVLLATGWELYSSMSMASVGTHGRIAVAQALTRTKENRMVYEMIE